MAAPIGPQVPMNNIVNSISTILTGAGRSTALISSLFGTAMAVELVRRGFSAALDFTIAPGPNWIGARIANWIHDNTGFTSPVAFVPAHKVRQPDGSDRDVPAKNTNRILAIRAFAFIVFGIIAYDVMTLVGGRAHPLWNKAATFIGPLRLNDELYHVNVGNALRGTWLGNQFGI